MTESNPSSISVVMPLYNAARFVAEALGSIRAQTLPVSEVIVVDDGSTDDSAGIAASFPFVTLLRQQHGGISRALNLGVENASGDYLSFLDADDRWRPEKTALQLAVLRAEPNLDMVFGHMLRFHSIDENGRHLEKNIDVLPGLTLNTMLIRRASFIKVGGFPGDIVAHNFMDWYIRAKEANLFSRMLPETVAERRIHDANYGILHRSNQRQSYFATLKAGLDRRRSAQNANRAEPCR